MMLQLYAKIYHVSERWQDGGVPARRPSAAWRAWFGPIWGDAPNVALSSQGFKVDATIELQL